MSIETARLKIDPTPTTHSLILVKGYHISKMHWTASHQVIVITGLEDG